MATLDGWRRVPWRKNHGFAIEEPSKQQNQFARQRRAFEALVEPLEDHTAESDSMRTPTPPGQGSGRTRRKNRLRYWRRVRAREIKMPGAWALGPSTVFTRHPCAVQPSFIELVTSAVDSVITATAAFLSRGSAAEAADGGDGGCAGGDEWDVGDAPTPGGDAGDGGDSGRAGGDERDLGDAPAPGGDAGDGGDDEGGGGGKDEGGGKRGCSGEEQESEAGDKSDGEGEKEAVGESGLASYRRLLADGDRTAAHLLHAYARGIVAAARLPHGSSSMRDDETFNLADLIVAALPPANDNDDESTASGTADPPAAGSQSSAAGSQQAPASCPVSSQQSVFRNPWDSSDDSNRDNQNADDEMLRFFQSAEDELSARKLAGASGSSGGGAQVSGAGGGAGGGHDDDGDDGDDSNRDNQNADDEMLRFFQSAEDELSARKLAGATGSGSGGGEGIAGADLHDYERARDAEAVETEEEAILAQNRRETRQAQQQKELRDQAQAERRRKNEQEDDLGRIMGEEQDFTQRTDALKLMGEAQSPEAEAAEQRAIVDEVLKDYVAGSFVDQRPAPAAASMVHDPTTLEEESIKGQSWDFDDELDDEEGRGIGLWGLPIRPPPSMEGINLFVYTHARAAELPSCLPKKGPKTHIIGIETPAIVRPKDPKGKECWGCGRSVGGTWTHTPWGPLCTDSSCGRVIRYNKQILELAVSGDAASASQKQGGYGCARQGQATVEDGLEIRHDYQSKWRLIRAELIAIRTWITDLHPQAEAEFTNLVRGGDGIKTCFTCGSSSSVTYGCMWPNKKICSACDSAWKDVFCSSRMEEAAEEVDLFLLWILFVIARRETQWRCTSCHEEHGGDEKLHVHAGVTRVCKRCISAWASYHKTLRRILQPEEMMSPVQEFIYWVESPDKTKCAFNGCHYTWHRSSARQRPPGLDPEAPWQHIGRCGGPDRRMYVCSIHWSRHVGVASGDMTPTLARKLLERCTLLDPDAEARNRSRPNLRGPVIGHARELGEARARIVDGTSCYVNGCDAIYSSSEGVEWYPKVLPSGEWHPFCPKCNWPVQNLLKPVSYGSPHHYLRGVVNLAEAHRKTGSNYISIWEDFADTLAIPAMVYLLKYHLRFDTIICAASPAYSTDPALSDLFPLRISTRRGYWRGSAANADHLGFKYGLPPTFVGFILSAWNRFRPIFDRGRSNGKSTDKIWEAMTNEVFQLASEARDACSFPETVTKSYNQVMKDEIEESGLGPWKWGGQKHNRVHGRAASVEKGVHEWRMKNADTTLQCAITGEFFLVGDSEANHSHLSATVGCVMPGSCNWALGPYETLLDELMIKVYPGDDIEKARSIRRAIHDAMRPSFVAYIDGTAPIVQSAQKVVEMLKEDTEMVAWGNAALGDAETCTKFYEELIGGNRPVAVAVKEYLELLSPEAITAEEFHRNVLWLRSWLRSTGAK